MNKRVFVGEIIPLRPGHDRVHDLLGAVVPGLPEHPQPANDTGAYAGNIVPFSRARGGRTAPAVALRTNMARLSRTGLPRERAHLAAFLVASLALHAGLLMALWRDPPPLASIGLEVISVEIVVGATAPAGVAPTEGEQQNNSAAAPETQVTEAEKAEEKATTQEQVVEIARQETAPEQKAEQPKAQEAKPEEPKKVETTAAPLEPAPAEREPAVAMVETPTPETATAKPQETPPPPTEVTLLPQPEEKSVEKKVERKPVQAAPPKPVKDAKPANEPRRIAALTRENASRDAKASTPSTAANNVGVGHSDRSTNYPGLVSAHLRRYQQYPSDARSRGDQGTATVSFSLDGGGRVTSARLARGSGTASIDQEVKAMVQRASPFPAPPGGRAQSFTVPVSFRLN